MQIAGSWVVDNFRLMMDEIKNGNFSRMDVMHHILAGMKAWFTENMMVNIDVARRSAGGAGFSANTGLTELFQNASPLPTYEGDNTVMLGQATRYLAKLLKKAKNNQQLSFPFTYLNKMPDTLSRKNRA